MLENEYQQRLDKVLSKFEDNGDYKWINLLRGIDITYNRFGNKKFLLWNVLENTPFTNCYKELKHLNTVESIIKDLKEE